jgi:uncharacterized membrane protein
MIRRYFAGISANRATPLLLLALTAAICSRATFAMLDDPEGPNLIVITSLTVIIFLAAIVAYISGTFPALTGFKRVFSIIPIQILTAATIYLILR